MMTSLLPPRTPSSARRQAPGAPSISARPSGVGVMLLDPEGKRLTPRERRLLREIAHNL